MNPKYLTSPCTSSGIYSFIITIIIYLLLFTVEPLIKDTPKEDKSPFKGQSKITVVYTWYKIISERGQPLCNGQNGCYQHVHY